MAYEKYPSLEIIHQLFEYDADNQSLYRRRQPITRRAKPSGGRSQYPHIQIEGVELPLHWIVWTLANGPVPDGLEIDHIDRDTNNYSLDNLRLATRSENLRNRFHPLKRRLTNIVRRGSRFEARISIDKKIIYLGTYDTAEEACAVRDNALVEKYAARGVLN